MEALIEVSNDDKSTELEVPVTELTVLTPRQTSSFDRRLISKFQNIADQDRTNPIQCEIVNWSLTGGDEDKNSLNIQISKSPRSSWKRQKKENNDVDNDFLKSPRKLRNLSVEEISECLKAIGLDSYVYKFQIENIDGQQFVDLDDDMLVELDVEEKDNREKILNLVKEGVIRPQVASP